MQESSKLKKKERIGTTTKKLYGIGCRDIFSINYHNRYNLNDIKNKSSLVPTGMVRHQILDLWYLLIMSTDMKN
jgi:hypothetical protein